MGAPTAVAALARTLVEACRAVAIDVDALFASAEVSTEILDDPEGRIDTEILLRLWALAAERSSDRHFGLHVGEKFVGAKTLHVVGYTARNSRTLLDCYEQTVRFARLTNEGSSIKVHTEGDQVTLTIGPAGEGAWPRCYSEMALAAYLSVGRDWTSALIQPIVTRFMFAAPKDLGEYHRVFGPAVEFGHPINGMVFERADLERPLREPDLDLRRYLEERAAALVAALPEGAGLSGRVRAVIGDQLGRDTPTIASVAERLASSPRTLQRRLAEESTTFAALLEDVRRLAALELITDKRNSLAEVASGSGYRDLESFRASFFRWTGQTPSAYRRGLPLRG